MESKSKRKTVLKAKKVKPVFPEEWIAGLRENLKRMQELNLDKPDRSFSKSAQLNTAYFCLAAIALDRFDENEKACVLGEAEQIHNRLGVSIFEKNASVPVFTR